MTPFSVRLSNSVTDQHITQRINGLRFRSVAPGGYSSASFSLYRPVDSRDPLLEAFTRVYIYDQTGRTAWEGRLAIPGRTAGDQGQIWSLAAAGPSAHTLDQTVPLVYIDRDLGRWVTDPLVANAAGSNAGAGTDPTGAITSDVLLCQFPGGEPINTGSRAQLAYTALVGSGQTLGAFGFTWKGGQASANYQVQASTGTYPTYLESPFGANLAVGATFNNEIVITNFPAGRDFLSLRLIRTAGGALTVADDTTWGLFSALTVLGRRTTADGAGFQSFTSTIHVQASWVIQDLLGRILTQYDGANAVLNAPDTVNIDQFAYPDGVTPSQVLDDLMAIEPQAYWAAWESNPANGKYRFEWNTWPTSIKYEASVGDGFDNPAPVFDLQDKVTVRYRDARGRIQRTTRTQTVPELAAAGITRTGFMDLGDEAGSSTVATAAGDSYLADHLRPISGGTLTVAAPILDLELGRRVQPWEIRPGYQIRVRGIEASVDILGGASTSRDGQTIFRVVSNETDENGVATLELDHFTPTEARALINLRRKRWIRKR